MWEVPSQAASKLSRNGNAGAGVVRERGRRFTMESNPRSKLTSPLRPHPNCPNSRLILRS